MTRNVKLQLDQFGQEALRRFSRERDESTEGAMRTAAIYYLSDREARRTSWRVPRFGRDAPRRLETVELGLDDDTWVALNTEAGRQGVEPELLLEHAMLYFLADLDSGRLARRIGEVVDYEPPP